MDEKSSLEKLRELGLGLPDEFAAFPVVLLEEMAVTGPLRGAVSYTHLTLPTKA